MTPALCTNENQTRSGKEKVYIFIYTRVNKIKVSEKNKVNQEEIKQLQESKQDLEQKIEKVRLCPASC